MATSTPWVAAKDPAGTQPGAPIRPVDFDSFEKVIRTGRSEPATTVGASDCFEYRVKEFLVEADSTENEGAEDVGETFHDALIIPNRRACFNQSASSWAKLAFGACQRRMVTT